MFEHPNDRAVVFKGLGQPKQLAKVWITQNENATKRCGFQKEKLQLEKWGWMVHEEFHIWPFSVAAMVLTIVDLVDDGNE